MHTINIEDDDLIILKEDVLENKAFQLQPWRILIVDDDGEVHQSTRFALSGVEVMNRPLSLIHAYSAAEAEVLLRQMPDIAVVLLDVVMEADDSGLSLIDLVRDGLSYKPLRIILRTGQPGMAPEAALVAHYDIHDYMLKTEVTRERLLTSLTTAVRTFDQLRQMAQMKQQMLGMMQAVSNTLEVKTPAVFAQLITQQLSSLYGLSPVVAVWRDLNAPSESATVLIGNLQHHLWQGKQLVELSDAPLVHYLHRLLSSHDVSLFSDAVVFTGKTWRFVVVLQENNFQQHLVAESWDMFQSLMTACANHSLAV